MIRAAALGVARLLFGTAVLLAVGACGSLYLSYRAVRFALAGDPVTPRRDAGFALLMAAVGAARAFAPTATAPAPPRQLVEALDTDDDAYDGAVYAYNHEGYEDAVARD